MIYLIAAVLSLVLSFKIPEYTACTIKTRNDEFVINKKNLNGAVIALIASTPFFLISALRYGVGTDYFFTYTPRFLEIANQGARTYYEFGFYLLNRFVALFTKNPQWLFVLTSALFVGISYYAIFRLAKNKPMSVAVFFLSYTFLISLNNLRQSLASAFLFIAVIHMMNDENIRALIWIVIAGLTHQVAFIFVLFLILNYVYISSGFLFVFTTAFYVIGSALTPIVLKMVMKIPRLALYFRASDLLMYNEKSVSRTSILINLLFLAMMVFLEYEYGGVKDMRHDKIWNLCKWNQVLIVCVCAFDGVVPALYRIVRIFTFMQFILIPNVVEYCENPKQKRLLYACVLLAFGFLFWQMFASGAEEVFPYDSILFH